MYGLGFYGAIDMGANIYQNRGGDQNVYGDNRHLDPIELALDDTLDVNAEE